MDSGDVQNRIPRLGFELGMEIHVQKQEFLWKQDPIAMGHNDQCSVSLTNLTRNLRYIPVSDFQKCQMKGRPQTTNCRCLPKPSLAYNVRPPRQLSWFITPIINYVWFMVLIQLLGLINQLITGGPHIVINQIPIENDRGPTWILRQKHTANGFCPGSYYKVRIQYS